MNVVCQPCSAFIAHEYNWKIAYPSWRLPEQRTGDTILALATPNYSAQYFDSSAQHGSAIFADGQRQ